MSVAGFIATQRVEHHIPHATACRALGTSQAWFYKWRHGDLSPRHARREQLRIEIRRLFAAHQGRSTSQDRNLDRTSLGHGLGLSWIGKAPSDTDTVASKERQQRYR